MEKAVFFDLDDTLVTHDAAVRAAARELCGTVIGSLDTSYFAFEERWITLNRLWYQRFFAGEVTFQEHGRGKLREAGLRGIWLDRRRSDRRDAGETIHDLRDLPTLLPS
jgi:putative hydrolase of the HAD superfamily